MSDDDVKRLRELPIEEVAKRLGMEVNKHWTRCPFHADEHPSMHFKISNNSYRCFVCGEKGNVIDLVMKVINCGFREAINWLADSTNQIVIRDEEREYRPKTISYPADTEFLESLMKRPVLTEEARQFLFDERHYKPEVVQWLGISSISAPTPCNRYGRPFFDAPGLLFPYRDYDGQVMNVQCRRLPINGEPQRPRFKFTPNAEIHVFNLPMVNYLTAGEVLYVAEGVTDCIAMLSAGLKAIAIPSATLLNERDYGLFGRLREMGIKLRMYPDRDDAGERLYQQLLRRCTTEGIVLEKMELPEGCKDFSEAFRDLGK